MLIALCLLLGLAVGSFLNVVVHRIPRGESVVRPPSACPACQHPIRPRDNVPVLGWMLLRGRCRDCNEPISVRYPLVEAATAGLFAVMAARFGYDPALPAYLYLAAVGLALALIDIDVQRLPDALTLPSYAVVGVLLTVAAVVGDEQGALLRALVGALALGLLYFVIWFAYPAGMGFGDVKLAPVLGACLGWIGYGALAVGGFLAFVYGGLFGAGLVLFKEGGRKTKVAFGPFMIAAAFTAILIGQQIADAYLDLALG